MQFLYKKPLVTIWRVQCIRLPHAKSGPGLLKTVAIYKEQRNRLTDKDVLTYVHKIQCVATAVTFLATLIKLSVRFINMGPCCRLPAASPGGG